MRNYLKRKQERVEFEALTEDAVITHAVRKKPSKGLIATVLGVLIALPLLGVGYYNGFAKVSAVETEPVQVAVLPVAATVSKKSTIVIPNGMVKANPFLPYKDVNSTKSVGDVPAISLLEPPEMSGASSDAVRVMDTSVSGILFDKYNPSAILNIEGSDYLVKKGDVVNNYKVLAIAQDSVTVQLGQNVYKAGIGEILTEGTLNHNDVSNLSNKFGGVR